MSAETEEIRYIIVGIGINVNHRQFPEPLRPASFLAVSGRKQRLFRGSKFLCQFAGEFRTIYQETCSLAPRSIVMERRVAAFLVRLRQDVYRVDPRAYREFHGVTAGLGETGASCQVGRRPD